MTADVIIMEEAAYIDPECFNKVVVPLMGVNNTVVLGISTPDSSSNYYSMLLDLKGEDDKPLFKVLKFGLACDKCIEQGKAMQCPHGTGHQPPWKSAGRQAKLFKIMQSQQRTFLRENMGVVVDDEDHPLSPFIPKFRNLPRINPVGTIPYVDIGIDPHGGGPSEFAIVSTVIIGGRRLICGIDCCNDYQIDIVEDLIINHLQALRAHILFRAAVFNLFIESNMSYTTVSQLRRLVLDKKHQVGSIRVPVFSKNDRPGVPTYNEEKIAYTRLLYDLLSRNRLAVCAQTVGKNFDRNFLKLCDQLSNWARVETEVKNPFQKRGVTFGGKSKGQDDLACGLMISCYYGNLQELRDTRE